MLTYPLTDGAELRALEPWLAPEFAEFVDRERAHLAPWLPWATRIIDADTARDFLQRYAADQAADGGRIYGIWLDGELAGGTLFRTFEVRSGVCEVGVWLGAGAQGRGLVTRAVERMIDWAVLDRGMARVEWRCVPDNARSIAVAQRLGMTHDGVLRAAFPVGGVRHDVEVWSVLADEWRNRARASGRALSALGEGVGSG